MQKVLSFTSELKDFPIGTVGFATWTVDGQVIAQAENITFEFGVGVHTIELSFTDVNGVDLIPKLSETLTITAPITIQLRVPMAIVITDVA